MPPRAREIFAALSPGTDSPPVICGLRRVKIFRSGTSHFRLLFSSRLVPKTLSPKYQSTMARFGTARENSKIAGLYVLFPGDGVLLPLRNMAPLIKDSVEVANSTTAAPAAQSSVSPKPAAAGGALRADALSLEVPVKVHGSRVTEVARGVAPHTEPFEEETGTMIVFPHGGVLRMSTPVTASQMLVVTNLKTRQDAICRVVKVRTFSNMQGYVEVEFTHQQPGYWGVHFPSEGPAATPVIQTAPVISAAAPVFAGSAHLPLPSATSMLQQYVAQHATDILASCAASSATGGLASTMPGRTIYLRCPKCLESRSRLSPALD